MSIPIHFDTRFLTLSRSFLYVLSAAANAIDVMSLNGPGNAKHIQTFNYTQPLRRSGVNVDSHRVQGLAVFVKRN